MPRSAAISLLILSFVCSIEAGGAMARSRYAHALTMEARRAAFWRNHGISQATRERPAPDVLLRQQAYWDSQQRSRAFNDIPGPP